MSHSHHRNRLKCKQVHLLTVECSPKSEQIVCHNHHLGVGALKMREWKIQEQ